MKTFLIALLAGLWAPHLSFAQDAPLLHSKVAYVMLGVHDLKTAVDFYGRKLGLKVTRQTDDIAFFDAGSISLVTSTEVGKEPGATEVVFEVEHVRAAFDALVRGGVAFEHKPHQVTGAAWAANFRDPDGHILSLFGPE